MSSYHSQNNVSNSFGITVVGHTDGKRDSDQSVVGGPIGDSLVDELGVRNNDDHVVIGADPGAAPAHGHNISVRVANFDAVSDSDWLLDKKDQSGDKTPHNRLQSEADTDANAPLTTTRLFKFRPADSRPIIKPRTNTR